MGRNSWLKLVAKSAKFFLPDIAKGGMGFFADHVRQGFEKGDIDRATVLEIVGGLRSLADGLEQMVGGGGGFMDEVRVKAKKTEVKEIE